MMFARAILAFSLFGFAAARQKQKDKYPQLDTVLNKLVAEVEAAAAAAAAEAGDSGTPPTSGSGSRRLKSFQVPKDMIMNESGDAIVEVRSKKLDNDDLRQLLEGKGVTVTGCFRLGQGSCSAVVNVHDLPTLLNDSKVAAITANFVQTNAGLVTSEAVQSMMVDEARHLFNVDGTGVKVCVMSDSFNCGYYNNPTDANQDVQNGDLPPFDRMEIFRDLKTTDPYYIGCSDEGRAMMQLIHDVAPGADLGFYTAFLGLSAFADAIMELVDVGCHIIVDDIIYFAEAWFQDDEVAQAVDYASDMGVPYFSSAGTYFS